ncbi:RICIN domain-containing protein [Streptomyces sp. RP5T]|uniref:RICIN domain-containing protein n=1 Tax=Streptomyces sp. RP5T TaxID=2490848 RepID=UPI00163AF2C8|nr:RICIN domain-containing protein [Streptomyces sp. RP5T]
MSRGEEADKSGAEGKPPAPGEPTDLGKREPVGDTPELLAPLPVIVSADGSVDIDGIPVPLVEGEAVDTAILDMLHGYARSRNSPVRAAISDPSADYVAIVQVEPDGSSRLVEQRQAGQVGEAQEGWNAGPAELASSGSTGPAEFPDHFEYAESNGTAGLTNSVEPAKYPGFIGGDGETSTITDPIGQETSVTLASSRGPGPASKRRPRQSDDEYEPPSFLKRPFGLGLVGTVAAAVIIVPLIMLGSSGSDDGTNRTSSVTLEPPPTHSTAGTLPLPSPAASTSGAPQSTPQPKAKSDIPSGEVRIKNKKYGLCLDLPGTGEGTITTPAQDGTCRASGGENQRWVVDLASESNGADGAALYLIRNARSGLCLDLNGYGPVAIASPVGLFNCDPSDRDNQLWQLEKRPNGTYWIRNRKSGKMCLDVARENKKAAHANVTIFPCSDLDDHQWSFSKG